MAHSVGDVGVVPPEEDFGCEAPINRLCDCEHACQEFGFGPNEGKPFPLPGDPSRDPAVDGDGVGRNPNGWLVLDPTRATFHDAWLALDGDGTVARVDTRTMKEVARYRSVTCSSLPPPMAGTRACDGTNGCCAADSDPQWQRRRMKMPEGPSQSVQLANDSPAHVAVDADGDAFVANRAPGGQASITKIAGDLGRCRDRNGNGRIDTSSDVDGDGRIEKNDPKEFLDLEDECVLWTTNHGAPGSVGRPLALGPTDGAGSDAFAGGYETGILYRIDGVTGKTKGEWTLPDGCRPDALAIDAQGFGWAANLGVGPLCYFDTRDGRNVGRARGTADGYGISLDRDQNVWIGGGGVSRYTPDRSSAFASLGNGYWTFVGGLQGHGIAADSRNEKEYFVWSATTTNAVMRVPASAIPLPAGMDTVVLVDPSWPKIDGAGLGVGLDSEQSVIAVPASSVVTRTRVDENGDFTQPDVTSSPRMGERCPAGDRCDLGSHLDTYSDFGGFGLRNFTTSAGGYSYVLEGCGGGIPTQWRALMWDADVPPGTSLSVRARSGPTPKPDPRWGRWTQDFRWPPADLSAPGVLEPNWPANEAADYLQVEFAFRSGARTTTPKLKSFVVARTCKVR